MARFPTRQPGMPHLPTRDSSISRLWRLTIGSSKYGRRIARRISKAARLSRARRSHESKAASPMPCAFTSGRSARHERTVSSTSRASPTKLQRRFYLARGFEKIAHAYLREARYCYLRWGADGKVRQLDELYPHLREKRQVAGPTSTIGAPVEQLDLATVIKVSQAVPSEIVWRN